MGLWVGLAVGLEVATQWLRELFPVPPLVHLPAGQSTHWLLIPEYLLAAHVLQALLLHPFPPGHRQWLADVLPFPLVTFPLGQLEQLFEFPVLNVLVPHVSHRPLCGTHPVPALQ